MKVMDVMTRTPVLADPDESIREVAKRMADKDLGFMPVADGDRLVGMVTDRDIAIRAVAAGKGPDACRVRDVMTPDVRYCFEDEDMEHVVPNMAEQQVRRMPVMNRDKRLVGIVTIADAATTDDAERAGIAMSGIAQPGGPHRQ